MTAIICAAAGASLALTAHMAADGRSAESALCAILAMAAIATLFMVAP